MTQTMHTFQEERSIMQSESMKYTYLPLLTNTEISKHTIENIFNITYAEDAAQSTPRASQLHCS